jgi:hypothetical protein
MSEARYEQARKLEDLFFKERDAFLIRERQELEHMERTQQALSEVSGITNQRILAKLMELKVTPSTLASMAVVPLVAVAWADRRVDDKERDAILRSAEGSGIGRGTVDYGLLEAWLKARPPASLLTAWIHYTEGLIETLTLEERQRLKTELLSRARAVAEAAGGFLGIGAVSASERKVLEKMDKAFHSEPV